MLKQESNICGNVNIMTFHCLLHQENLCSKSLFNFQHVVKCVVKIVNFIRSNKMNHRQFQNFLKETGSYYDDVIYYTEVRWLSLGKTLQRVFVLREEIKTFMEFKGIPVEEFQDKEWMCDFGFLIDITGYLNELNLNLQRQNQLIHTLYDHIKSFKVKLALWKRQFESRNFAHFPSLDQVIGVERPNLEKYIQSFSNIIDEFENRFSDFKEKEILLTMFSSPFSVNLDLLPTNLQLEFAELQCDSTLKDKFLNISILEFYSKYLSKEKYPGIHKHAIFITSMFGSTYKCEQLFSQMKNVKSSIRSRITDEHLESSLRIATTNIEPDLKVILRQKQCQISH
jgi:hypothetical protein